jgi:predicted regulator of Ras-like GTPase activity (Roadblock/LC7/MglB family)
MTFRDLIEGMHRKDPSIMGGALAGSDGLAVDEWSAGQAGHDIPALCAEMVHFFRESARISRENGLGGAQEFFLAGDVGQVYVRRVTDDYYLLLVADSRAIPGKCRFILQQGARLALEML